MSREVGRKGVSRCILTCLESIVAGGDKKKRPRMQDASQVLMVKRIRKKLKKKRTKVSSFGPCLLVPISTFRVLWPVCVVVIMAHFGRGGGL